MKSIFFYGTLRDTSLLEIVLDREIGPADLCRAAAHNYAAKRHATEDYPVLVPSPGAKADGAILSGLQEGDVERLTYFEEAEYRLGPIQIETAEGPVDAICFLPTDKPAVTDIDWDYAAWEMHDRAVALEATRELMDQFGRHPVERIDELWPSIMTRARQRARAKRAEPVMGAIRTGFAGGDVVRHGMNRAYTGFLTLEEWRLSHRRFDGGWTRELNRAVVLWGDAVTVIPYDPRADQVLLIEQFRAAPAMRGDRNPWLIEVVAGRIDGVDTPEDTARREALEETGLTLGRLERIAQHYPSPGIAAEYVISFVGEANLSAAELGTHGLETEGEDIRTFVLPLDQALAAAAEGAITNGAALTSLYWLAFNRTRLQRDWAGA